MLQEREVSLAKEKQVQVRVLLQCLTITASGHEENALRDVTKATDVEATQHVGSLGEQLAKVQALKWS